MKTCTKCKETKSLECFSKTTYHGKPTLRSRCKDCEKLLRKEYLKEHGEKVRLQQREHKRADYAKNKERYVSNKRLRDLKNPEREMFIRVRLRAKYAGIPFDLQEKDLVIPSVCPVLKVKLQRNTEFAPSLDRLDNTKGYVKNNVWIISQKANRIKNNSSLEELELLVAALKKQLNQEENV